MNYWTILLELFAQYYGFSACYDHQQKYNVDRRHNSNPNNRIVIEMNKKRKVWAKSALDRNHIHINNRLKGNKHTKNSSFHSSRNDVYMIEKKNVQRSYIV